MLPRRRVFEVFDLHPDNNRSMFSEVADVTRAQSLASRLRAQGVSIAVMLAGGKIWL